MARSIQILLMFLFMFPLNLLAKSNESILMASNITDDTEYLNDSLVFWSKIFVVILITILAFFSYKRFRSEEQ